MTRPEPTSGLAPTGGPEHETGQFRPRRARASRAQLLLIGAVTHDGASAFVFPRVAGEVQVGRGSGVALRIADESLSRRHASFHVQDDGAIEVEDLGSVNGTRVGGRPLAPNERASVGPGDVVMFGTLVTVLQAVSARPAAAGAAPSSTVMTSTMTRLEPLVARIAPVTLSVLILGETGVGKEVLARAIHARSPRAACPLLCLNCAALTESLLESELFGFERGAFTGAVESKPGLLESADGGTVLLDEVGELPLAVQAKLLRVLENREVQRLGARKPMTLNVRFLAATHRDLEREVERGTFRRDLYFRLNGISIVVPPLRERTEEILPLAEAFAAEFSRERGGPSPGEIARDEPAFSDEARELLVRHTWPGNIRELRNAIERAVLLRRGATIDVCDLPAGGGGRGRARAGSRGNGLALIEDDEVVSGITRRTEGHSPGTRERVSLASLDPSLPDEVAPLALVLDADEERRRIVTALEHCHGNQTRAARLLGVSRRTLIARLETYAVPRPRKRAP
jgi:transcriptional regulator with GAF, ATPase, and Fis domain